MSHVRLDQAFLLRPENIARYEAGKVIILDRRKYPAQIEYVECANYIEVAQAIKEMVTQSGGPYRAAALGMASAARAVKDLTPIRAREELERACYTLSHARPTTSHRQQSYIQSILAISEKAISEGSDPEIATLTYLDSLWEAGGAVVRQMASYTLDMLPQKVTILTQCYAESVLAYTLLLAQEAGKEVALICPETRPYLQGARLTASIALDLGIPVTVITDNMPGFILSRGMADVFISGADVVTLDGYVVNKIGTFQIALASHFFEVPYYVFGNPSSSNSTISSVEIEERDPQETLHFCGLHTTREGVKGYYPAFDITPPHLVSAVVTSKGVFSPYDLKRSFGTSN